MDVSRHFKIVVSKESYRKKYESLNKDILDLSLNEARPEKTRLWGFRPSRTQTGPLSY